MATIDQIVNVSISQQTTAVAQASFSVPLIMGPTSTGWASDDYVHVYTSAAGMLTDGFISSSPEYIYAQKLMSQTLVPTQFFVGKRGTAVAQVNTLAVNTVTVGAAYTFTLNGISISYTALGGDTQQDILTSLNSAIVSAFTTPPVTGVVSGTGSSALLTLTAGVAGDSITYGTPTTNLTLVQTVASKGIASDIASVSAQNDGWYGVCICSATDAEILQAAAYVESVKKILVTSTATAAVGTNATTDVASRLKAAAYKRTALLFSPAAAGTGISAAWLGGQLPAVPGSNTWAFKSLAGVTVDTLTATQINACIGNPLAGTPGKNANIHTSVGGVNITQTGVMASGQYIDITVGIDWLVSKLQTNTYSAMVNATKIPYTDTGVTILLSAVRAAIDEGVANGLIDGASPITVTAPKVLSVPANQRANRIAPTISFGCRLQGAVHAVQISGTVTV